MESSDKKIVFGLSIANIALSGLAILVFVLIAGLFCVTNSALSDPALYGELAEELYNDPDLQNDLYELRSYGFALSSNDIVSITSWALNGLGIVTAFGALLAGVSLVAGILGVRNYSKPEKLGATFGWAIAGAVTAFICGRWISTVLLIMTAVFIHKVRKNPEGSFYVPTQTPYGSYGSYGSYGAGQPGYIGAQPGYTAAQPGQYAPYGQPVGYGAPEPTNQPYGQPSNNQAYGYQAAPFIQPSAQQSQPDSTPAPTPEPTSAPQPEAVSAPAEASASQPTPAYTSAPVAEATPVPEPEPAPESTQPTQAEPAPESTPEPAPELPTNEDKPAEGTQAGTQV